MLGARYVEANRASSSQAGIAVASRLVLGSVLGARLSRAVGQYDRFLLTIKTHPWFDPVRDDPRFIAVLQRMNVAD